MINLAIELIEEQSAERVLSFGASCFPVEIKGEKYFLKRNCNGAKLTSVHNYISGLRLHDLLKITGIKDIAGRTRKEVSTMSSWRDFGLPVPRIVAHDNNNILYKFVESSGLSGVLNEGPYSPDLFDDFLGLYNRIRVLAYEENDPDLLHSDPHLENFLVSSDGIMPIDPGVVLRSDLGLPDLDAKLNLYLCYSLFRSFSDAIKRDKYMTSFLENLSDSDVGNMTKVNERVDFSSFKKLYWGVRNVAILPFSGKNAVSLDDAVLPYSEKTYQTIEGALGRRLKS